MFQVQSDKAKNLLEIHFSGNVTVEEAKESLEKVRAELSRFQQGFTLLTDLSKLENMSPACAPSIEATMDACRKAGVGKVVRVIPDPHKDIGLSIMSLFHYPRKIRIITCETMNEAKKILAE
jgi:anti-anti-sigma regulatory factor